MRAVLASLVRSALLAACGVTVTGPAPAQPTPSTPTQPPMGQACRADFQKFCADVRPGSGRVAQCLLAHRDRLSPACHDALLKVEAAQADKADAGKPQ